MLYGCGSALEIAEDCNRHGIRRVHCGFSVRDDHLQMIGWAASLHAFRISNIWAARDCQEFVFSRSVGTRLKTVRLKVATGLCLQSNV